MGDEAAEGNVGNGRGQTQQGGVGGGNGPPQANSATLNDLTWTDALQTLGKAPNIDRPAIGGFAILDDEPCVFVGSSSLAKANQFSLKKSDSDADEPTNWVCQGTLVPGWQLVKGPGHPNQWRPTSAKGARKTMETCTTYHGGTKYYGISLDKKNTGLTTSIFKDTIEQHCANCGMWDVFQVHDQTDPLKQRRRNLLRVYCDQEFVNQWVDHIKKMADTWTIQNLNWSGTYLLSVIGGSLCQRVIQDVGINAEGPKVLAAVYAIIYNGANYDSMQGARRSIEKMTLKDVPNEDVLLLNFKLKDLFEFLASTDALALGDDLLENLVRKYVSSSNEEFRAWAHQYLRAVKYYVSRAKLAGTHAMTASEIYSFERIMHDADTEYRTVVPTNVWSAKAADSTSSGYLAEDSTVAGYKAELDQLRSEVATLRQQKGPGEGGADTLRYCFGCKKRTTHAKQDCPVWLQKQQDSTSTSDDAERKKNIKCWGCKQKGHIKADCPNKRDSDTSPPAGRLAAVDPDDSDDSDDDDDGDDEYARYDGRAPLISAYGGSLSNMLV